METTTPETSAETPRSTTSPSRPASVGVDALTTDGGIVRLRPVTDADATGIAQLYGRASAECLRLRFFGAPGKGVLDAEVARLCRTPAPTHAALLAELPGPPPPAGPSGTIVGVASYERASGTDPRAEFAVFVDQPQRGRGIGTLLLEHLAERARADGVTELIGEVLPGNSRMLRVANDLAAQVWSRFDDGVVDVGVGTEASEATLTLVDARERAAERASLRALFAPTAIAVFCAGGQPGCLGHETVRALAEYGFIGATYPIDADADDVAGWPTCRSASDLPGPIDLAVIAVPAADAASALRDAAGAGARAAVVLSAGFGEDGPAGRARQADLLRQARDLGVRLVGPNCVGVLNTDPAVRLDATIAPGQPRAGGLAVAAQSGAVGIAILDHATRTGIGISSFVSLGNKADVSGNDLLAYWHDDPATDAVALYLESFGNPRRFARLVRSLGRRKPVLAVKSGRSVAGRRAGAFHTAAAGIVPAATGADTVPGAGSDADVGTASAATADIAVDTLFAQAGVVRAENLGELLDAARLLTRQPLPAGHRLAVLGNAGGVNVLAADAAEPAGLAVPALGTALSQRLARLVNAGKTPPADNCCGNPLDLGPAPAPDTMAAALDTVAGGGEVDAVLVVVAGNRAIDVPATLAALGPVADRHPDLPIAVVVLGAPAPDSLGHRRIPVFDLPERAVRAIGHAAWYASWRREPLGQRPPLRGVDPESARVAVGAAMAHGGGWQPYPTAAAILRAYGIPLLGAATAPHPGETIGAVELVAGVVHDPLFGSLVLVGLGGLHTELLGDRAYRLVPVTDLDAGRMWRSLRAAPLLTGYRGAPPVRTDAVEDLLLRLGRLAEDLPEIAELDLNPVIAGPDGVVAADVRMRLAALGPEPDAVLRRLRQPDWPQLRQPDRPQPYRPRPEPPR